MALKKYLTVLISAVMLFGMVGCNEINQTPPRIYENTEAPLITSTEPIAASAVTTVSVTTTAELTGPEFAQIPLHVPDIYTEEAELICQAEDQPLPALFKTMNEKTDYTGSGYISGLSGELNNTFIFNAEIPSAQHYDISVVVCAEEGAECTVFVNDEETENIIIESSDRFISATIPGIYMETGTNKISIQQVSGDMLLDCIEIHNNISLKPDTFISAVPVNENASSETKTLLQFLCDNYGKAIISGQQVSDSSNSEIERIFTSTGKYPVIRFADMYLYSLNGGSSAKQEIVNSAVEWSESGGITGLMWHWFAPVGESGKLEESEQFSLSSAVTFEDIACLTPLEIENLEKKGEISKECAAIIEDIDSVSEGLKELKNAGVPVLWHPLHQGGDDSYWWNSSGSDVYRWLWDLVYKRMTEYHKLDNLLWVWSGTDEDYLPYSSEYDIAAADIYLEENEIFGSGYESYYALQNMTDGKLIALSECSSLPDITSAFRDGSVWSYFGLWYEPYLEKEDNQFVDTETLIRIYNSEGVLTRDDYIEYCSKNKTSVAADESIIEQ